MVGNCRTRTLEGTPSKREEGVQGLLREVGRGISEAALNEAAAQTQHPCCCGRPMENRGRRRARCRASAAGCGFAGPALAAARVGANALRLMDCWSAGGAGSRGPWPNGSVSWPPWLALPW